MAAVSQMAEASQMATSQVVPRQLKQVREGETPTRQSHSNPIQNQSHTQYVV
jgi:hypothetical protein